MHQRVHSPGGHRHAGQFPRLGGQDEPGTKNISGPRHLPGPAPDQPNSIFPVTDTDSAQEQLNSAVIHTTGDTTQC